MTGTGAMGRRGFLRALAAGAAGASVGVRAEHHFQPQLFLQPHFDFVEINRALRGFHRRLDARAEVQHFDIAPQVACGFHQQSHARYDQAGEGVGFLKVRHADTPHVVASLRTFVDRDAWQMDYEDALIGFFRDVKVGYEVIGGLPWTEINGFAGGSNPFERDNAAQVISEYHRGVGS